MSSPAGRRSARVAAGSDGSFEGCVTLVMPTGWQAVNEQAVLNEQASMSRPSSMSRPRGCIVTECRPPSYSCNGIYPVSYVKIQHDLEWVKKVKISNSDWRFQ